MLNATVFKSLLDIIFVIRNKCYMIARFLTLDDVMLIHFSLSSYWMDCQDFEYCMKLCYAFWFGVAY